MTGHLQRLLLLLHKAARRQPASHRMAESTRSATHRLRIMLETLQVRTYTCSIPLQPNRKVEGETHKSTIQYEA